MIALADNVSREVRRKTMQAIKSNNTSFENRVRKGLWRRGSRSRNNVQTLMGKPYIAIKKYKVALFLDSFLPRVCRALLDAECKRRLLAAKDST
ncbi:hypothetical protein [Alicyclobacillus sp. ALC3]|uniref:hypothetical protein n=1 Tax=Alicyclobacillus sp. ALC3 TaxID=2796143 RepID=UPI0023784C47|nr:hypothetical protein [Alicyclobacillus sp. ALC3]